MSRLVPFVVIVCGNNQLDSESIGPLNVINAVEVDFHEGADVVSVVFAQVEFVAHALVIIGIELRQVVLLKFAEAAESPGLSFVGAAVNAVVQVVSQASTESKSAKENFEIGGGGDVC